ncbi:RNA-binding domain-containing protein [Lacrimispora sp.]|uniref:RNA-binding domain-containing protein n=1 Tax=Lacrimispora sp. TaxID=2719234 RepID=UPI0028B245A4|nr:RNA-binding domain-containing protein [Lacrimispora sp.]
MIIQELRKLIESGEKIDVEFKRSRSDITKDVYDTVCSFNNRNGGHIFLGVKDDREILGVEPEAIDKILRDFTTAINNANKIYPPLYLTPEVYEIEPEIKIIYIRVPEGGQVRRHNGIIWDRTYEGDIDITRNEELVYKMYARKQGSYYVNKVFPGLGMEFLNSDLIKRARKMATGRVDNHPWAIMNEEEILRSSGLILTDMETYKEGITLAAILLFGKDSSIMSVMPQYKTDAIYRVENVDRYDDRDVIITNLISSYDRLMEFGKKHLNDVFVLEGIQSVSARDRILREVISNILAHRDFSSGFPAKFIIEKDKIYTENSNLAHGIGELRLDRFEPFPKNPPISKVFREIGLADELGSGMRNTNKYTKLYSGGIPSFDEGDIFKITIPLKNIATAKVGPEKESVGQSVGQDVGQGVGQEEAVLQELILKLINKNNRVTKKQIAKEASVSEKTVERQMKKMTNVKYVGRGYSGHWEIRD